MFDAKTLSDGQKEVIFSALLTRKRAPQAKSKIGVSAFIMGVSYWIVSTLPVDAANAEKWLLMMEWFLLAGTVLSAALMLGWLWIEHQAKNDLRRIGLPESAVQELLALKNSDLDKFIRE